MKFNEDVGEIVQMVQVNKYEHQVVEHFDSEDNSLGFLNNLEHLDLRCQIAEQKAEGYYLMLNDKKIIIKSNGKPESWPVGLYETELMLFSRLFKAQRTK